MTYVLRTISADRTSRNGFKWPESGAVECPDWDPKPECGNGLHGFLWGEGDGNLADWSADAIWLVVKVDEYVGLVGKVKFPRCDVVFSGSRFDATNEIIRLGAKGAVMGSTLNGGDYSTLTGGYRSTLNGGDRSTLNGGHGSTLTGGRDSILQWKYWDGSRYRIATHYTGENGVKANTAYRAEGGKLVEVTP